MSLDDNGSRKISGTDVPVLPDRTLEVLIISLDVPKSDSMALGLGQSQSLSDFIGLITCINFPSSHVSNTFPGFKSRCRIDFSC